MSVWQCSSTEVLSSWKAPDAKVDPGHLDKVLVGVLSPQEANRRRAEEIVAEYHESFIPSYQVLGTQEILLDTVQSKAILKRQNFDGAILFRLIDQNKSTTYVPGSSGMSVGVGYGYWGYHSAYWGAYYDPGYYREDVTYVMETIVYSFEKDDFIWTGVTSTLNPTEIEASMNEITRTVFDQMRTAGLFVESNIKK